MKNRNIVIAGVVILAAVGLFLFNSNRNKNQLKVDETPTPSIQSTQQKLEEKFKTQIPSDVEKAELKDITGGDSSAIVTRKYDKGIFSSTVLADMPEPQKGDVYQSWLVRGEEGSSDYSIILMGNLRIAKGGYLLDYSSNKDLNDYKKVVITEESKNDRTPEKHILEGSF